MMHALNRCVSLEINLTSVNIPVVFSCHNSYFLLTEAYLEDVNIGQYLRHAAL